MSLATLNGVAVTRARLQIPAWGVWYADVECASTDVQTGAATLVLDDVTFVGTILSGGTVSARTQYRIAGGAGGWGRRIGPKAYANDIGVKASKVISDAARECGESVGTLPTGTAGSTYVRAEGPASSVLAELAPEGWYVDEAGVTQIGARASSTYTGAAPRTSSDASRAWIELAPASLAGLLPGVVVDGVTSVDVEHVLEGGALRTSIWGAQAGRTTDPVAAKLAQFIALQTASTRYFAPYRYRVVLRHSERYDLQCVRRSTGMPDLLSVRVCPGVAGARAHLKLGSIVTVQFLDGDPGQPVIAAGDDYDSGGFIPDELALLAGSTGSSPTEHATSAEALVAAVQAVLAYLGAAITALGAGAPTNALTGGVFTTASSDAGMAAIVAAAKLITLGVNTKTALDTALSTKAADTLGTTPGLGWPNVRGG